MKKILFFILSFVQISLLGAVAVVQDLTKKKAGVNHHLRFYRTKYNNVIFTPDNVKVMKIVLIIIAIILAIILVSKIFKAKKFYYKYLEIILAIICAITIYICLISTKIMTLLVYPYFVFALAVILILQLLKIVFI